MNASAKRILKLHRLQRPSRKGKTHVRKGYLPLILLAALFAVPAHAQPSAEDPRAHHITITPADVLEDCVTNESGIECTKKTVIGVPVAYGDEVNLEVVEGTTIEQDVATSALEETVTYKITKSQPEVIYPLTHLHTVSYFPYEEIICVDTGECVDSPCASNPTCGWTYQGDLQIPHSQGFCCRDDAHCLRQGELFFHGYEIDRYRKTFTITVEVTKGEETHEFEISPEKRVYTTKDDSEYLGALKLRAELVGEFPDDLGPPELDNYILYIPSSPDTHPFVQNYQNNMLLVPREEVSLDGGECDKVGVSFHTFRSQGDHCSKREPGDCLHNQLFHKHNSDLQKLIMNPDSETTYLVHGKRWFKGSMDFEQGMKKLLTYKVTSSENSLVSLTVDAETVKVVQTESIGRINYAQVMTFTSMSRNGTMVVAIENRGDLETDYTVTVTNCNMNILHAIPQQSRTLEPFEIATLGFEIYTAFNLATSNQCLASLTSPTGRLYDEVTVIFDTLKHQSKYSWDLQEKNEATQCDSPPCDPIVCDPSSCEGELPLSCGEELSQCQDELAQCCPHVIPAECGDGTIQWKAGEDCDPPGSPCGVGRVCDDSCQCTPLAPACGDGVIQWRAGETCDPPGSVCGSGGNPDWVCSETCSCEFVGGE
jgi:hypothetical protein